MSQKHLRHLPPVGQLLEHPWIASLLEASSRPWLLRIVQEAVDEERAHLLTLAEEEPADRSALTEVLIGSILERRARVLAPAMRRVLNATGVVVHTNLGRSCYPPEAADRMREAAVANCDLEMDLESGLRGHRGRGVEEKLALLTGAEDALVVNNNAAALWLAVRACSRGARVILSRGEVVAIGGSFRLHDIVRETGCEFVEVGTVNRTSLRDYEEALTPGAVVLKVHRSNFVVTGFTEEVSVEDLSALCRERGHVLIYDAGSGLLEEPGRWGLPSQATVTEDLAAGADLVTWSGDKLFGGGQAGLVLGRSDLVANLRRHPMRRAFRVDKTTLAALDGVLDLYMRGRHLVTVPTLMYLERTPDRLEALARGLGEVLSSHLPAGWSWRVVEAESQVGGGAGADSLLPGRVLQFEGPERELERCHRKLRHGEPAVVARMSREGLGLDVRALADEEIDDLAAAVRRAWS